MRLPFDVGVRDSTVYVGNAYRLRVATADRLGNVVEPAYAVVGAAVRIAGGDTVAGEQTGSARVVVTSGTLADTVSVTIPPRGRLAVYYHIPTGQYGIGTIELDGSVSGRGISHTQAGECQMFRLGMVRRLNTINSSPLRLRTELPV